MSKPNDGGPAFAKPISHFLRADGATQVDTGADGMSLRAYLTGRALPAVIAGHIELSKRGNPLKADEFTVARDCIRYADALISELAKETQ